MSRLLAERFWDKVDQESAPVHAALGTRCWLWTACVNALGYGSVRVARGRTALAHRVAWELEHGAAPKIGRAHV